MSKSRIALFVFVGAFAFVVVCYLAARLWFDAYLHGDEFRRRINRATSNALKTEGEFQPFHFTGSTIYSDGFRGTGELISDFRADQIRAEFNWRGIWQRAWEIDGIDVQRIELNVAERGSQNAEIHSPHPSESIASAPSSWLPNHVDLRRAIAHEMIVKWAGGSVTGAEVVATPDESAWAIAVTGGHIAQRDWPGLKIDHAKLRYRRPSLFVTDAVLETGNSGSVAVTGEINFGEALDLQLKLNGVPVTPLLTPDWRARLKGNLSGDVRVRGSLGLAETEPPRIEGTVSLAQGTLEALPILNQIAVFTRTQQFRTIALTKTSAAFSNSGAKTTVNNFVVESEGLIRIEGNFVVENARIDGTFQVGVTPSSLQWLPGSQERVFTVARGGYVWAPMRLSGPLGSPSEDLSPRLIAAAQGAVIEGVEGTVRETTKGLLDIVAPLLK